MCGLNPTVLWARQAGNRFRIQFDKVSLTSLLLLFKSPVTLLTQYDSCSLVYGGGYVHVDVVVLHFERAQQHENKVDKSDICE